MGATEEKLENFPGAPTGDKPAELEEAVIVVSDLHMSEGLRRPEKYRPSWWRRLIDWSAGLFFNVERHPLVNEQNPLEDFPDDSVLVSFLGKVVEKYAPAKVIRLKLLGDTFDPLAVIWNGHFSDPPYERVASGKIGRIMHGHQAAFDALAAFVRRPNCCLDIFVGNHDLCLCWPRVQLKVLRRLTGGDPALFKKIRFIDATAEFREIDRGVLYEHGTNAEGHNVIDPKSVIVRERFGIPLKEPVMDHPIGNLLTVTLVNHIKWRNPLVGRLTNYRSLLRNGVLHRWGWSCYVLLSILLSYLRAAFFSIWLVRVKTGFVNLVRIIYQQFQKHPMEEYAQRVLRERSGEVRAVIMGHSHVWQRISANRGTYLNTGTWSQMFEMMEPKFDLKWRRFRRIEQAWRTAQHLAKTGELRFGRYLTRLFGWITAVAAMIIFLLCSFPAKESWRVWNYDLPELKEPIAIILGFVLLSGLIRLLAVRPTVVSRQRFTFGLVRHFSDGGMNVELMEWKPEEGNIRECV